MSSWLLVVADQVIDGSGQKAFPASVLVRDDSIAALGARDELLDQVPRGESVDTIEASGCTVMPGHIDAHCHMTFGDARTEEEIDLYTPVETRTLIAANNLQRVLRAGVTSISDAGGTYYIGVALREAVKSGLIQGPRICSAARFISTSNGLTDYYPESVGVPSSSIMVLANSVDEMLAEVRKQVKNGADFIKLADSPAGEYQAFRDDELKQISDLAHQLGKKVTIHARGSREVGAAVRAGLDWIMHGNTMEDDVIDALASSNIPLVPTMLLPANIAEWGDRCGASSASRDHRMRSMEKTADALHRARKAGVRLLAGTDTGFAITPYGEWHAREMELLMTYAGMSALEAIRAMTKDAAETVNLGGRVGEIAPGMLADLLVVNGDPSRDIRLLLQRKNIHYVIKNGERMKFDDAGLERRFAHQRVIAYSTSDLRYDDIYGDPNGNAGDGDKDSVPNDASEGDELAHEIALAGRAAADG
jgi:imidazolonepropionase-like amidohydrolase